MRSGHRGDKRSRLRGGRHCRCCFQIMPHVVLEPVCLFVRFVAVWFGEAEGFGREKGHGGGRRRELACK